MKRLALAVLVATGCTKSDLYIPELLYDAPPDNRLRVTGTMCAEPSDSLASFLKVMLVIDRSNSMQVTDPNNQRIAATQDLVRRFVDDPRTLALRAGVELAVVSFYGDVVTHTRNARGLPGFSHDGAAALFSLTQVARTGSLTSYSNALGQAFLLLDTDMARLDDAARARSRYEVVFISDGYPEPDNCIGESNSKQAALRSVQRIRGLAALHGVSVRLHAAYASTPEVFAVELDNAHKDCFGIPRTTSISGGTYVANLLYDMAVAGDGNFRQFRNGDAISFADFEFGEAGRTYALASFVATNLSAQPRADDIAADSDFDGLTDDTEITIGTLPFVADSDGDGFGDGIEWRFRNSGFDPLDPTDALCTPLEQGDLDGDGLRDCEELVLGTSRRSYDTDADGLSDPLEVIFGGDGNSATPLQDYESDNDADGGSNADELRWHTDPRIDDVSARAKMAYDYVLNERPLAAGAACYDFNVRNIALASTTGLPEERAHLGDPEADGWNRVMFYFVERPADEPLGDPLYRLACVEARYVAERDLKMPATGLAHLPARRPGDSYRPSGILRPNDRVCYASVNQDCGLASLWCRYEDTDSDANGVPDCTCSRPPQTPTEPADGVPVGACPACANGVDDDGDGLTDFPYDPDCFDSIDSDETSSTACKNGIDDDGDELLDWPDDPGCTSGYDLSESDPATPPQCADGIDDDDDGAIDFPHDPGCDAAADTSEASESRTAASVARYACDDGEDNDGDGLVDLTDPGCSDDTDVDESGPEVCFFCEALTANRPGQCDLGAGYCKPRSGDVCTTRSDCRGAPCINGRCVPCLADSACDSTPSAGDGLCNPKVGWCFEVATAPSACTQSTDCAPPSGPGGACVESLGICAIDPYDACRGERDCRRGEICSPAGFCLTQVFETTRCAIDRTCAVGDCDAGLGWCLPSEGSVQCRDDEECPFGSCRPPGYCEQPTFVPPTQFRAERDCIRER
ncbi:MAG: VWA domain-containing protein [Myxococcota bacterium]